MFKGCLFIAIVLVAAVITSGVVIGGMIYRNAPALLLLGIEECIAQHQTAHPEAEIPAENAAWTRALTSDPDNANAEKLSAHVKDGLLVDEQGNAIQLTANANGVISAFSAGEDGEFGTEDDVASADLPAFLRP